MTRQHDGILPLEILKSIAIEAENVELIIVEPSIALELYPNHPRAVIDVAIRNDRLDIIISLAERYNLSLRIEEMELAIRSGSLSTVKFLQANQVAIPFRALDHAAQSGNVELFEYLMKQGLVPTEETLAAAVSRHWDWLIDFLLRNNVVPSWSSLASATGTGDLGLVMYIAQRMTCRNDAPVNVYTQAVYGGSVEVLDWLFHHVPPASDNHVMTSIIQTAHGLGRQQMVELIRQRGYYAPPDSTALKIAIENDVLPVIKELSRLSRPSITRITPRALECIYDEIPIVNDVYLAAKDDPYGTAEFLYRRGDETLFVYTLEQAARKGSVITFERILRLFENNPSALGYLMNHNSGICRAAAAGGNLRLLKLVIRMFNLRHYASMAYHALAEGHVEAVKWLKLKRVDNDVVEAIIKGGHLNALKYAVEHGYQLDGYYLSDAFVYNHYNIVMYMLSRGCQIDGWYRCDSLELVRLLLPMINNIGWYVDKYITNNNVSAVKLLLESGLPVSRVERLIPDIIERHQHTMLSLLIKHGASVNTTGARECNIPLAIGSSDNQG